MIQEQYVSFETAKLLREKEFDGEVHSYYGHNGRVIYRTDNFCKRPTQAMAMRWLREIHRLDIYFYHDVIQEINEWWYQINKVTKSCSTIQHKSDAYLTYEEAVEAALKYSLENLI